MSMEPNTHTFPAHTNTRHLKVDKGIFPVGIALNRKYIELEQMRYRDISEVEITWCVVTRVHLPPFSVECR